MNLSIEITEAFTDLPHGFNEWCYRGHCWLTGEWLLYYIDQIVLTERIK